MNAAIWSHFSLENNQRGFWRIGPLSLFLTRTHNEWEIAWKSNRDSTDNSFASEIPTEKIPESLQVKKLGFRSTSPDLTLTPALADRSVVVKPEFPLIIPPKEKITLYVSIPLWVQVGANAPKIMLADIPTYMMTETWFGPQTNQGEICYALRASATMNLNELPHHHNRAITAIKVFNEHKKPLQLERLKVPVGHLSLFCTTEGHFFTESITMERGYSGKEVHIKLSHKPFKGAGPMEKVSGPRQAPDKNIFIRTYESLFE